MGSVVEKVALGQLLQSIPAGIVTPTPLSIPDCE